MGKEVSGVASRTAGDDFDVIATKPGVLQLMVIGFHQIKMSFRCRIAMPGRTLIQKKHWVSDMLRFVVEFFVKELVRITELRIELGLHLGPDDVAAFADARSYGSAQIARH